MGPPERQTMTHTSNRILRLEGNLVVSQFKFFISQAGSRGPEKLFLPTIT